MSFPVSKKDLALEIKKKVEAGEPLVPLLKEHKLSTQTYYKWAKGKTYTNKIRKNNNKAKAKNGRRKRAVEGVPSVPTSFITPPIVAGPQCPQGYVMIMVPKSSLAGLFGDA